LRIGFAVAACLRGPSGLGVYSSIEFQLPQDGHFPYHLELLYSHSVHM